MRSSCLPVRGHSGPAGGQESHFSVDVLSCAAVSVVLLCHPVLSTCLALPSLSSFIISVISSRLAPSLSSPSSPHSPPPDALLCPHPSSSSNPPMVFYRLKGIPHPSSCLALALSILLPPVHRESVRTYNISPLLILLLTCGWTAHWTTKYFQLDSLLTRSYPLTRPHQGHPCLQDPRG